MQSNEPDRVAMTHFTSQAAAAGILDGWRHEILKQDSGSKFGPKELSLRLYSRYGMNDPTEYLHEPRKAGDGSSRSRLVFPDTAFIYCGAREIEDEALDRLDLWRAYGADGHGIAITTIWSKKGLADDGLDILKIKYVTTPRFEKLKNEYEKLQTEIDKAIVDKDRDRTKELHKKRMNLEVGYKGSEGVGLVWKIQVIDLVRFLCRDERPKSAIRDNGPLQGRILSRRQGRAGEGGNAPHRQKRYDAVS